MTTHIISNNTAGANSSGTDQLMLRGSSPNTNSANNEFRASSWDTNPGVNDLRSSLFRADLSGVPSGNTITAIRIKLWQNYFTDGPSPLDFQWGFRNWVKNEATWNIFAAGNNWATAGAAYNSLDSDTANPASFAVSSANDDSYVTFTMNAAIIANAQAAYAAAGEINLFLSMGAFGNGSEIEFTKSNGTDGRRPIVEIDYTPVGGGSTVIATSNITLVPLTTTSAAALKIAATSNKTLSPLTTTAAAASAIAAASNKTLAPLTSVSAVSLAIAASSNKTLAPLTTNAAAASTITAASNKTLAALTTTAAADIGSVGVSASVNVTFAPLTTASSAALSIYASSSQSLAALTTTSTAASTIAATSNKTLAPLTTVANVDVGFLGISGSSNITLAPLTSTSSASTNVTTSVGVTFSPLTTTSSVSLSITAISNKTLQPLTSSANVVIGLIDVDPGVIAAETPAYIDPFNLTYSNFNLGAAPGHFHLNINPLLRR